MSDPEQLDHQGRPLPKSACPVCGYAVDAATPLPHMRGRPRPGDLTICLKCAELLVFNAELKLMRAELVDLAGLTDADHQQIARAQQEIRRLRGSQKDWTKM